MRGELRFLAKIGVRLLFSVFGGTGVRLLFFVFSGTEICLLFRPVLRRPFIGEAGFSVTQSSISHQEQKRTRN